MLQVYETIAFVFGLVGLGYLAGWSGLLKLDAGDRLTEFVVAIALPALLFRSMMGVDLHEANPWGLWIGYFSTIPFVWFAGHLVITKLFGREKAVGVVGGVASSFSNLLLLGFPFIFSVFGKAGIDIFSLLLAVHLPVMMAASIVAFEWVRRGEGTSRPWFAILAGFLKNLASNSLILGIVAGILWRATGLSMPALGMRFIDAFAGIAGTVALFAMGIGLRKFDIAGNVRPALVLSILKLVFMPMLALSVAWLIGLPPLTAQVMVVASSLPAGVNPYLIASRFGVGQMIASNTTTISTALAVLTTGFWLAVVQAIWA